MEDQEKASTEQDDMTTVNTDDMDETADSDAGNESAAAEELNAEASEENVSVEGADESGDVDEATEEAIIALCAKCGREMPEDADHGASDPENPYCCVCTLPDGNMVACTHCGITLSSPEMHAGGNVNDWRCQPCYERRVKESLEHQSGRNQIAGGQP